ncbi:MAG TPA: DUF4258 domain-containing protein [Syntrophorhabdaceae bacterium]|nr:DUF4258 domain-containing protein [Syntrophorhabdaceae bacterium]
MTLIFSRHAKRQMKWRMITEDDVKLTINSPDRVEDTIRGRKNVYKMLEGRTLKITYTQEDQDLVVVTAMVKGGK